MNSVSQFRKGINRNHHDNQRRYDHRFSESQGKMGHRFINPVEDHADRILFLRPDPAPDEKVINIGVNVTASKDGEQHGEGFRVGQGLEETSRLSPAG